MTEQDYEKLMCEAAFKFASIGERFTEDDYKKGVGISISDPLRKGFKAGVAFARANPAPEVLELVEACENLSKQTYGGSHSWAGMWSKCECGRAWAFGGNWNECQPTDSCPMCVATKALTRFKERRRR